MLTQYHCYIIVFAIVFSAVRTLSDSFKWKLKSQSIVFGEDVELSCNGNACQPNTIKKWIGGPDYKLLCFVGYSLDDSKYKIMVNDTTADFGLMIKNFDINDTYCSYTCTCGIHQYTHELELEGMDYVYPPVVKNISVQGERKNKVAVQMTVYPLPVCYITYKENVSKVDMMNTLPMNAYAEHRLQLYNVVIDHTMDMEDYNCNWTLFVTCYVGKRNYTIINQGIDMCKDNDDTSVTAINGKYFRVAAIITGCVFFFIVMVLLWKIEKNRKSDEMSGLDDTCFLKCLWKKRAENNNEPMQLVDEPFILNSEFG